MQTYHLQFYANTSKPAFEGHLEFNNHRNSGDVTGKSDGKISIPKKGVDHIDVKGTNWFPKGEEFLYDLTLQGEDSAVPHCYLSLIASFKYVASDPKNPRWGIAGQALLKFEGDLQATQYFVLGTLEP